MSFEQQKNKEKIEQYEALDKAKRPERAEAVIKFLDKVGAYDFFQEISRSEDEKNKITFEQFQSFLTRINGIVRDIPIHERKKDGENVQISGGLLGEVILPPRHEDKGGLLNEAFEASMSLDVADNAYMLPAVINNLHLYNDGNGRTSRILHLLLQSKDKASFDVALKKALMPDGRFDTRDINPGIVSWEIEQHVLQNHGWSFDKEKKKRGGHEKLKGGIASAEWGEVDFNGEEALRGNIEKYKKISSSDDLMYLLTATIETLSDDVYDSILVNEKLISPPKLKNLKEKEWKEIFSAYYNLKKEHIETLMWIFRDPETYRNPWNEEETLKDYFIRKIEDEYKENNKGIE